MLMRSMNPADIYIRSMRTGDIPYVVEIDRLSFSLPWPSGAYEYELKNTKGNTSGHSQQWVAASRLSSSEVNYSTSSNRNTIEPGPIMDQNEIIVGMIISWYIVDEVHIATLAVRPDYRRQGIAERLLSKALSEAIGQDFYIFTLEVRAGNIAAQRLYLKFGFEIVGKRPRYYKDNQEDALIMTLKNIGTPYETWLREGKWDHQPTTQGSNL